MSNKFNIGIDVNNFLWRHLSTLGFQQEKIFINESNRDTKKDDMSILFNRLTKSLFSDIILLKDISLSIVLCVDSSSWRKSLESYYYNSSGEISPLDYKGNRSSSRSDNSDLKYMFECFEKWLDYIDENTEINILKYNHLEADDLLYHISKSDNWIIYTSDNDLKQLVNSSRVIIFDKQKLVISCNKDFINLANSDINLKKFITRNKITCSIIDGFNILFEKVLLGDKSDNIPSVYSAIRTYQSGKKKDMTYSYNFTPKYYKKIKDELMKLKLKPNRKWFRNEKGLEVISKLILKVFKYGDYKSINHNLKVNIELIDLDSNVENTVLENLVFDPITNHYIFFKHNDFINKSPYRKIKRQQNPFWAKDGKFDE